MSSASQSEYIKQIPKEKIVKAYTIHGSYRAVASLVGLSRTSVMKAVKEAGLDPNDYPSRKLRRREYTGGFAEWIQKKTKHGSFDEWVTRHRFVRLPRSYKKIADISGHTYESVRCYFRHRRRMVEERIMRLPDLADCPDVVLEDDNGEVFGTQELSNVRYRFDKWTFRVRIRAEDAEGVTRTFTIKHFDQFAARLDETSKRGYA